MFTNIQSKRIQPVLIVCLITFTGGASALSEDGKNESKITYDDQVKPILMQRCGNCHNSDKKSADLDLSNYTNMMQGGASGAVIEPGAASDSYLFQLITHEESPIMPPGEGNKLPAEQILMVAKWIDAGALENQGSKARISKPKFEMAVSGSATKRPRTVATWPRLSLQTQLKTPARPRLLQSPPVHGVPSQRLQDKNRSSFSTTQRIYSPGCFPSLKVKQLF